jgi:hypothetical protein
MARPSPHHPVKIEGSTSARHDHYLQALRIAGLLCAVVRAATARVPLAETKRGREIVFVLTGRLWDPDGLSGVRRTSTTCSDCQATSEASETMAGVGTKRRSLVRQRRATAAGPKPDQRWVGASRRTVEWGWPLLLAVLIACATFV